MTRRPKFSIITICLNEVNGIRATCESVVQQTAASYEWIVIDGGSTDGTREILDEYADRIQVLVSETDSGIYHAMNKGAALSSGQYLIFMNGGDRFYDSSSLEKIAAAKQSDVIVGNVQLGLDGAKRKQYPDQMSFWWLLKNMLPHQAAFIRRDIFERSGGYDEAFRVAGDYELFVRLFGNYSASYSHVTDVIAIFDSGGISQSALHRICRKRENHCIRWRYFVRYRFTFKALREAFRLGRAGLSCPPPALPKRTKEV